MSRRRMGPFRFLIHFVIVSTCILCENTIAHAQTGASFTEQRPFVVGVVPFVSNGAVGGVSIDASGAIQRAEQRDVIALRDARRDALSGVAGEIPRPSKLRKVSLRRLDALLAQHASQNKPLPSDLLFLAGLQRVEYVFAYPDSSDIVLAGPAEAWTIDDAGNAVGTNSRAAVLQLVDLIAALRTTDELLAGEVISCSIDPTPDGLKRSERILRGARVSLSDDLLRQVEQAAGPQTITLTGVSPESHFAQVLVAADWQMKRLAMGLAPSPVNGLTSYLEMLKDNQGGSKPHTALPRWWIAYGEHPVERDAEGLGWRISRPGIKVHTAAAQLGPDGQIETQPERDPIAKKWADSMTAHYDQLALAEPVFGQLRGCMDLALVTAIAASSKLLTHAHLESSTLLDEKRLQLAPHRVPKNVASQASALKAGRTWIVSVSGGVDLDVPRLVNTAEVQAELREARTQAVPTHTNSWWWD